MGLEARFLNETGEELLAKRETDLAKSAFEHAIRIDPAFDQPLINLGILLRDAGETGAAFDRFVQAFAIAPGKRANIVEFSKLLAPLGRMDMVEKLFARIDENVPEEIRAMDGRRRGERRAPVPERPMPNGGTACGFRAGAF